MASSYSIQRIFVKDLLHHMCAQNTHFSYVGVWNHNGPGSFVK